VDASADEEKALEIANSLGYYVEGEIESINSEHVEYDSEILHSEILEDETKVLDLN
jgi:hypothetical protein